MNEMVSLGSNHANICSTHVDMLSVVHEVSMHHHPQPPNHHATQGVVHDIATPSAGIIPTSPQPRVRRAKAGAHWALPLLLGAALAACSDSTSPTDVVQFEAGLSQVQSCGELERYLKDAAIADMERHFERLRAQSDNDFVDMVMESGDDGMVADAPTTARSESASSSAPDHSETNNQVQGVDEADIVKTDGNYVYVLSRGVLEIAKSFPIEDMQSVGRLKLSDNVYAGQGEMFLEGDRVVLMTVANEAEIPAPLREHLSGDRRYSGRPGIGRPGPGVDIGMADPVEGGCAPGWCGGASAARVSVIDVSDRTQPRLVSDHFLDASYLSSREVDSVVRVAFSTNAKIVPVDFSDHNAYNRRRADDQIEKNRERILATSLEEMLPKRVSVSYENGTPTVGAIEDISPCESFYRAARPEGTGILEVLSFHVATDDAPAQHLAVLGQGSLLYASEDAMYIAAHPHWSTWSIGGEHARPTFLHKFSYAGDATNYEASGTVPGWVLNQFSMDEHRGFLRVATTEDVPVERNVNSRDMWWQPTELTNHLFVLEQQDNQLNIVGSVQNLAPTERVFSARFQGERGYLVTFRQVDPLFTFDLRDPRAPKKMAELKIPGFSEYMHPLKEDGYLVTVGRDGDDTGRLGGLKVTVFDVRDLRNPRTVNETVVGRDQGTNSEASYNHKAFAYFPEHDLMAIPISHFDFNRFGGGQRPYVGLKLFRVTSAGVSPIQVDIQHTARFVDEGRWSYSYQPSMRRSFRIEDHLFALSDGAISAHPIAPLLESPPMVSTTSEISLLPEANNDGDGDDDTTIGGRLPVVR